MSGPLEKLKILDLSQGWAAPFCTMELGDLGADVIKVEPPGGDFTRVLGGPFFEGESLPFLAVNRSKRSVVVDWDTPQGVEVIKRLATKADALVESFAPGEADRLGIGFDALKKANSRLIYASMSPFGQEGPYRDMATSDLVTQAMGGFIQYFGDPGAPPVTMGGDQTSMFAGKYLFQGIMAALLCRERRGIVQRVDMSMLAALVGQPMAYVSDPIQFSAEELAKRPQAMASANKRPPQRGLATKDMAVEFQFLVSGYIPNDRAWLDFFQDIKAPELAQDTRFNSNASRAANRPALDKELERCFATMTAAEILAFCGKHGGMAAAHHTIEAAVSHPQTLANDMVISVTHPTLGDLKMIGVPAWYHGTPVDVRIPPPTLGQHTVEVLTEAGYSRPDIESMVQAGVV